MSAVQLHVFVLEDNDMIAELIRFYLEEDGYIVHAVTSGRAFFEAINRVRPDLVTIDVELPDMTGFQVLRQMHANPETRSIPTIFISVAEDRREEALKLGASGFVTKPFVESELREATQKALKGTSS